MIIDLKTNISELRSFLILWITQSFSSLGSAMTNFAVVIWSYQQQGSALTTALLMVCSYGPYVLLSIFAGALSDRWNKKVTMLVSDSFAALCTVSVLLLLITDNLQVWHLYAINTLNGMMNTVQQPASDVAITLLTPEKYYQKVSGMRSFSQSLVTVLTPVLATAILSFTSIHFVILFDLITFAVAFVGLLFFVKIPKLKAQAGARRETVLQSVKTGLQYLGENRGILDLILFLAVINFTASIFSAALPAMLLSRTGGGEIALGMVNTLTGVATILGSLMVTILPPPKSRVRVICNCLLFSMSTENFILAFGRNTPIWCLGAVLGWIFIPVMNANMDVLFRSKIPLEIQGRVYSARNTLQFFTIPLGYLSGGILVDRVFEPFMAVQWPDSLWVLLFGSGKGSGAAMLFFVIGMFGALSCLPFRADRHIWNLEK
ncbi:MFS transporter [Lacrimispora saccharolytica]|uniref:Major facilitator superfamily MFS_1 n=1 Tax=Lacrimispora saccharolytica (strain ATCC 35040 / DSM 2544 / NRCC 2533 / WM1) TaxID=610130 RepID=D9R8I7_LACSW|nr:MFS transporter [Lacrimispora saccharolytica]ADL05716.1 major facilitator superfamily MFS_1 [[Clostridium] saccharolyticum WM1]QRV20139.1 MFS transporter [Lacrimispora saccharolytica]